MINPSSHLWKHADLRFSRLIYVILSSLVSFCVGCLAQDSRLETKLMFGIFLWVCKPILKGEKLLYLYIRLDYIHCLMSNWIPFVGFLSLLI